MTHLSPIPNTSCHLVESVFSNSLIEKSLIILYDLNSVEIELMYGMNNNDYTTLMELIYWWTYLCVDILNKIHTKRKALECASPIRLLYWCCMMTTLIDLRHHFLLAVDDILMSGAFWKQAYIFCCPLSFHRLYIYVDLNPFVSVQKFNEWHNENGDSHLVVSSNNSKCMVAYKWRVFRLSHIDHNE